jgi:hypothetical protein
VVAGSCRQPQPYVKPQVAITVFKLLMMSGVSLQTCRAIKKHWNNKFYYTVAFCWLFLYDLYYDAQIHEHKIFSSTLSLTSALDWVGDEPLYPGKRDVVTIAQKAGWGPRFGSGRVRKISFPKGFVHQTVQPVAGCHTN